MYTVYVLRSLKNARFYTGSTSNLNRRISEHNSGKSKYTKFNGPFELIYKEEYNTRSEAVRREMFLKTGKGRKVFKKLIKDS